MEDLHLKIDEWNRNALELFRISKPNENNEFFGVVRFYFYGPNDKYYSKCVNISSNATARHLVNVLVEKFHPDLRLLKSGRYALYEYHPPIGERRLGADERPLINQINWKSNPNDGRFILRDESKHNLRKDLQTPPIGSTGSSSVNMAKWRSAGNLMAETTSIGTYGRSQENLANSTDEIVFPISNNNKAKGKSATKKKTKSLKSNGNKKKQKMSDSAMVEQAVMRTASLPNFLGDTEPFMNQNRGRMNPQSGSLTINLRHANLPDQNQNIQSNVLETTSQLIQRILGSYGRSQHMEHYSLEQFNHPPNGESLPYNVPPHRILRPDERPLHILRNIQAKFPRIRSQFHLFLHQDESASLQEELISTQPDYANITVKKQAPQLVEVNPNGTAKTGRVLRFNLSSLVGENGEGNKNGVPVKVGSQFNSVGPPPNIVLSANRFPDIRPVHCTLLPVSSNADGGSEKNMGGSILISPALDITLRPPGPTAIYLDGKKVVRLTPLRHGCILQLGRSLFLKFLEQGTSLDTAKPIQERIPKGSMPDLSYQGVYKERNRSSSNQPTYANTDRLFPDHLPIIVDVCLPPQANSTSTKDDFAACLHEAACDTVDAILKLATSLSFHTPTAAGSNARSNSRPPIFVLTPAFLLYGFLRGCLRRWKVAQLTSEQQEHYLSGLLNHIGSQMFHCIQNCCQTDAMTWITLRVVFNQLLFWLANSSELKNFLHNDVDFHEASQHSCQLLSNCIDLSFHALRRNFLELVKHLSPSLLFPGDYDQQDDIRLDDRSLPPNENIQLAMPGTMEPHIQQLLQCLSFMMRGMRQACVNVSFALQFFAFIFHAIGAWTFNSIVQTELKKNTGSLWTTRLGAGRLLRRLQRIKQWASRHGLGSACEINLLLPVQTCQLITADRSKFRPFQIRVLELRSLNSAKVEWLLSHLGDPPPLPSEWVKNITKSVRQDVDREIIEKHGSPSSRETRDMLSLQSPVELPLPLIIPPDGYATTSRLIGIPEGFLETVQPLIEDGCISVRRNESAFEAPFNGMWVGHFRNGMDSKFAPTSSRLSLKSYGLNPSEVNIDKLAREAGVLPATVNRVILQKNGQPLGIGIVAAKPEGNAPYGIYIRHIVPGSVAAQDGRLEYGDQILAIANSSLVNCDQSETAVAILARITNTVHLVIAKRAAQARGIINLINSAQSGRPLPNPMSRSNVSLNRATSLNQVNIDDIEDDDDDDSEDAGAKFGSRMSLGNSVSQNSIFPPRSTEGFSNARGDNPPRMREFDVSSDEITSDEEGSDEVWQPNEKPLNPNHKVSNERPSPPNESHSFQPSPASVQGSLENYKFRSQQDLRSAGHSAGIFSATVDTIQGSSDWNEVARHNAEVIGDRENRLISPTLSSLSSTKSIITQEERRGPLNISKPLQEGVYTNASEMTSDSDDLLISVKEQIPSGNRVNTAEKNTSPLNMSPAKSVTDKAMQTIIETTNVVEETEIKKSASQVSLQASAVQTEPLQSFQVSEQISTYTPPLNRLPMIRHPDTSKISSTQNPPITGRVQVEDVTKAIINPYIGRFQQQPQPSSRSFPKVEILTTSSSYSDLRMPYSTASVNTDGRAEPSTIQSGVTYWSSQTDLAYTEASPPPEPTADFPQYHPPERLEPSELAIKFGDVGTPKRYQKERSPTSPSAPLSVFGPPASRYIPERNNSRDTSPLRIDLIQKSRELTTSNQMLRSSSLNRVGHQEPVDNQSRQLQELSGEIRRLEDAVAANPNVDLVRDLDKLRVEYRFQLQLNDRSRTRSLTAPYMRSPDVASSRQPSSNVTPLNASVNRPMVPNILSINGSKTKPMEDYANERLEAIRMQEQRTRLYEESFNSKPDSDYKTNKRTFASPPPSSVPPMQPKYTYQVESGPLYDEITSITATSITPRYPQTIRQPSPSAANSFSEHREPSFSRGTELRASRKSVTFDTNLESVTLYSPHSTPPDNSTGKNDQARRPVVRAENQPITHVKRDFGFKSGVTQPENAENLSFKDKMAFFAKAIGDDMPKDRFKASQKERQIMNSLTR